MTILVINPGSTSTKLAIFQQGEAQATTTLVHDAASLAAFAHLMDQIPWREALVRAWVQERGRRIADFDAIIARGGLMAPVRSGVMAVDEAMLDDLRSCRYGSHASNLGAIIATRIAPAGMTVLTADPVVVDEMEPLARLSGHPEIPRRSIFHALNHKAVARRAARHLGKAMDETHLVVAHMGGGISVAAHQKGQVVDVTNALDGEGPFSPERSGALPLSAILAWFAQGRDLEDIQRRIVGKGGMVAYLGTTSAQEAVRRMEHGDPMARLVLEAMAYQIAQSIGAMATVLSGQVDAVVLTGGLAHCAPVVEWVRQRVAFIAPVLVFPGEDEMAALAEAASAALHGEIPIRRYQEAQVRPMHMQSIPKEG